MTRKAARATTRQEHRILLQVFSRADPSAREAIVFRDMKLSAAEQGHRARPVRETTQPGPETRRPKFMTRLWSHVRRAKISLTLLLVVALTAHCQSEDIPGALRTKDAALEAAIALAGIDRSSALSASAADQVELIKFEDTTTPFLGELAANRTVWRVILPCAFTSSDGGEPIAGEVFLDSTTGTLLKIVCNTRPIRPDVDLELSAAEAEEQLRQCGEIYTGFPVADPIVGFVAAARNGPHDPLSARQIVGQYVLLQFQNKPPTPVWVITFRGIPPLEPMGGQADWIPEYQRNRIRMVINAVTGKVAYTSTIPGLPLLPEDRERVFPGLNTEDSAR